MARELRKAEVIPPLEEAPKVLNVLLVTLESGDRYALFSGHRGRRNLRLHNSVNSG